METLNTTGSMSRVEYGDNLTLLFSYSTVIGYVKDGKAILNNHYYSSTTAKHQAKFREMYSLDKGDTFELGAFYKRADLDGVSV
tara:strand:+ start:364 stop:615 length:252 start_codon:yes stop_codon:yes gene_type:complete